MYYSNIKSKTVRMVKTTLLLSALLTWLTSESEYVSTDVQSASSSSPNTSGRLMSSWRTQRWASAFIFPEKQHCCHNVVLLSGSVPKEKIQIQILIYKISFSWST